MNALARAALRAGERVLAAGYGALERAIRRRSPLGARPLFDAAELPWTREFECHYATIRAELEQLLRYDDRLPNIQDLSVEQRNFTDDDKWKTVFLMMIGTPIPAVGAACPRTFELVRTVPHVTSAFFSILRPGKVLTPHRGPYAGFLRYHLGLIVPEPDACGLRVDGVAAQWQEGRGLLFDDSFEHSAWNEGSKQRAVLVVDVERPLPPMWAWLNRRVIGALARTSFATGIIGRQTEWSAATLARAATTPLEARA